MICNKQKDLTLRTVDRSLAVGLYRMRFVFFSEEEEDEEVKIQFRSKMGEFSSE